MTYNATQFDAAVATAITDMGLLDQIVNGSVTTDVVTGGGTVPSYAKLVNEALGGSFPHTWTNAYVPVSGNTTIDNTYDGVTIDCTTNNFYAVNLPTASTLKSNLYFVVRNAAGNTSAKAILGNVTRRQGPDPGFLLYPGESYLIYNVGNQWDVLGGVKKCARVSTELFVDFGAGSDNLSIADGLSTGARAYKTITAAISALYNNFDHMGSEPSITVASGVINDSVTVLGKLTNSLVFFLNGTIPVDFGGTGGFYSVGTDWRAPSGAAAGIALLELGDDAVMEISNLFFDNSGSSNWLTHIQCHNPGVLDFLGGCGFGPAGGTSDGSTFLGADSSYTHVGVAGNFDVVGSCTYAFNIPNHTIDFSGGLTVTLGTGAAQPSVNTWFRIGVSGTMTPGNITYVNSVAAGCQKWIVGSGGTLTFGSSTFANNTPGSVAGVPTYASAPTAATGSVL